MRTTEELFDHIFSLLDQMEALTNDMENDLVEHEETEVDESESQCLNSTEN